MDAVDIAPVIGRSLAPGYRLPTVSAAMMIMSNMIQLWIWFAHNSYVKFFCIFVLQASSTGPAASEYQAFIGMQCDVVLFQ